MEQSLQNGERPMQESTSEYFNYAECTAGLYNFGTTCFMNSSLQCLANVPGLRCRLCSADEKNEVKGMLAPVFAELLRALWSREAPVITPQAFREVVGVLDRRFCTNEQQDSMEFLEFLLDRLKDDFGRLGSGYQAPGPEPESMQAPCAGQTEPRSSNLIEALLGGRFRRRTVCPESTCAHESVVDEMFFSIKLPLMSPRDTGKMLLDLTLVPPPGSGICVARLRLPVPTLGCTAANVIEAACLEGKVEKKELAVMTEIRGGVMTVIDGDDTFDIAPALSGGRREQRSPEVENQEAKDDSSEQRICPDDGKVYTFSELKAAWGGEYSEQDLRGYWQDAMGPLAEELPEGAQCGVVLHIRCVEDSRRRELVGAPLVFRADRRVTTLALVRLIQRQLQRRFARCQEPMTDPMAHVLLSCSEEASGGLLHWTLFQASAGWDACKADTQLLTSDENAEKPMGLRAREHLVVEFRDRLPAAVERERAEVAASARQADCIALESCFKWHGEPEQLDERDALRCQGCNDLVPLSPGLRLQRSLQFSLCS
jgi:hypothetical protein